MGRDVLGRLLCFISALLLVGIVCLGQGGLLGNGESRSSPGSGEDGEAVWFISRTAEPGEPLTVQTAGGVYAQASYEWYVGGERIENTEPRYIPGEDDLEKMISVSVTAEGREPQMLTAYCSRLPVLYIDVEDGQGVSSKTEYLDAEYWLQGAGEWRGQDCHGNMEIRARGNDSYLYDKKSFRLKLMEKADLLGMGENRHWVLLANYLDTSLMRNALAYSLAQSMEMIPSMENHWVVLVMNGEYAGNYQLVEQVRIAKDRIPITDWDQVAEKVAEACISAGMVPREKQDLLETSLKGHLGWLSTGVFVFEDQSYQLPSYINLPPSTGGFVLELDEYYDEPSQFRTDRGLPVMFHQPEAAATNEELFSYTQEYIQALEDAVWAEDGYVQYRGNRVHYSDLLDVDSMVKYWLICEYFFNVDIFDRSCFMYKDITGKLYMGPVWDMDWSSGYETADMSVTDWAIFYMNREPQIYSWGRALVTKRDFTDRAYEIYWKYRNAMEGLAGEGGSIDRYYGYLYESAVANDAKWLSENANPFEVEAMEVVRPWLTERLAWMDGQFASPDVLYQSLNRER